MKRGGDMLQTWKMCRLEMSTLFREKKIQFMRMYSQWKQRQTYSNAITWKIVIYLTFEEKLVKRMWWIKISQEHRLINYLLIMKFQKIEDFKHLCHLSNGKTQLFMIIQNWGVCNIPNSRANLYTYMLWILWNNLFS